MDNFISTGSQTYAHKASRVLSDLNIKHRIVKHTDTKGCGYGVEIYDFPPSKAVEILSNAGVKILEEGKIT